MRASHSEVQQWTLDVHFPGVGLPCVLLPLQSLLVDFQSVHLEGSLLCMPSADLLWMSEISILHLSLQALL